LILNKHELVSERQLETCIDRIFDLELDVPTPRVLSQKGRVDKDIIFGLDAKLAQLDRGSLSLDKNGHGHKHDAHDHDHEDHQSEVEVLSLTLSTSKKGTPEGVDLEKLQDLLKEAPKDEVYRIKAILYASSPPASSNGEKAAAPAAQNVGRYILNWAFGRWTFAAAPRSTATAAATGLLTPADSGVSTPVGNGTAEPIVRMTIIAARGEALKWKRLIERDATVSVTGGNGGVLSIHMVG